MGQFKSKKNGNKKDNGRSEKGDHKKVKYVWISSKKAIYLVTGKPRESKYSYGVPIIPLHGYYRANGKSYTAKELTNYYVILNLPKDADIDGLKEKRLVVMGYDEDEIYIDANDNDGEKSEDKNESKGNGKGKKKVKDMDVDESDESKDDDERGE